MVDPIVTGKKYQLVKGVTIVDGDRNGSYNKKKDKILIGGRVAKYSAASKELKRLGIDLSKMGGAKLSPLKSYARNMADAVIYAKKGNVGMAGISLSLAEDEAKKAKIKPFFPKAERTFLIKLHGKAMNLAARYALRRRTCLRYLGWAKSFAKYSGIKFSDKSIKNIYKAKIREYVKVAWEFAEGKHLKKIADKKKWAQTCERFAKYALSSAKRYAKWARIKFPKGEEERILVRARKQ